MKTMDVLCGVLLPDLFPKEDAEEDAKEDAKGEGGATKGGGGSRMKRRPSTDRVTVHWGSSRGVTPRRSISSQAIMSRHVTFDRTEPVEVVDKVHWDRETGKPFTIDAQGNKTWKS